MLTNKIRTSAAVIFITLASSFAQGQPAISAKDLQPVIGSWQGSLTYLDYTTNKPYTMPANVDIEQLGKSNMFTFTNSFPKEPNANWTDTFTISADGKMINKETVTRKKRLSNGNLEIVTKEMSIDGNEKKPALIRHTYTIGKNVFMKKKEVKFVGTGVWIKRNEYRYTTRTGTRKNTSVQNIVGTYVIDLRPTPSSEPYLNPYFAVEILLRLPTAAQ